MRTAFRSSSFKYLLVSFGGVLVSVIVWRILSMEWRYAVALLGGIAVLCFALATTKNIVDFLVYALILNTSFDRFGKWLFPRPDDIVFAHGISLGLAEILLLLSYSIWFFQIFVAKKEKLPRLWKIDTFMLLLLFAQVVSMLGAGRKDLAFFDIIYTLKRFLIYFFLSRKIKYHHLKWIVVIILFTIALQSSIALFERATGLVGIGHFKGSAKSIGVQNFEVPGIEDVIRAEGTTDDSHSLGLLYIMLLPVPLVLSTMRFLRPLKKFFTATVLIFGVFGLLVTYTRSGWVFFAASSVFALAVVILYWKQPASILTMIAIVVGLSLIYPQGWQKIHDRFKTAPIETITERFEMVKTALNVWRSHFFWGCGSANYLHCLEDKNVSVRDPGELPVHVVALHVAAETGLVGIAAFLSIVSIAMFKCSRLLKYKDLLIRALALALLTAFVGWLLDGFSSPLGRNVIPYYLFWVYVAISMSFQRIIESKENATDLDRPPSGYRYVQNHGEV